MAVLGQKMGLLPGDLTAVMQHMDPISVQIYGVPGGKAAEMDKGMMDSGVPFTGKPRYLGGFTRQR